MDLNSRSERNHVAEEQHGLSLAGSHLDRFFRGFATSSRPAVLNNMLRSRAPVEQLMCSATAIFEMRFERVGARIFNHAQTDPDRQSGE